MMESPKFKERKNAPKPKVQQRNAAYRQALKIPEKTVLISPAVRFGVNSHHRQSETIALVRALGLELIRTLKPNLTQVHAGNYLSSGVIERLALFIEEHEPELVIVDVSLSPVQQRNLERYLNARVIDRHGVILEIFAKRARSHEGKIQVELANLKFQESRLVRSWTHLERQRGGLGTVGGPGESQLEIDRRLLREQITIRERKIAKLEKRRALQRRHRQSGMEKQVALLGYTNAGKTTLFNLLTGAKQKADNRVFETLDTTLRRWMVAPGLHVILGDTVGFIDDLPPDLIHAFRATLEEILYADVIIHLHDYHAPERMLEAVNSIVEDILNELPEEERPPLLKVYNKCEDLSAEELQNLGKLGVIAISAEKAVNIDLLHEQVHQVLEGRIRTRTLRLKPDAGQGISWLYRHAEVLSQDFEEACIVLKVRFSDKKYQDWQNFLNENPDNPLFLSKL